MTIKSINEPDSSRTQGMLMPRSINEPLPPPAPRDPAVLSALNPTEAAIGDPDFELKVGGEFFNRDSVIVFNGGIEPTTYVSGTELSTIVKPSTASVVITVPVLVRNSGGDSNSLDFSFTEAAVPEADTEMADPDDLEDEIEQSEDEGDFIATHRGKSTKTLPTRRKK